MPASSNLDGMSLDADRVYRVAAFRNPSRGVVAFPFGTSGADQTPLFPRQAPNVRSRRKLSIILVEGCDRRNAHSRLFGSGRRDHEARFSTRTTMCSCALNPIGIKPVGDLLPGNHAIGKLARQMETSDAARPFWGRYTERTQIYAKVLPCLRRRASGEAV